MPKLASVAMAMMSAAVCQEWYSVEQLETISDISKWIWRRWAQTGKIASAKVSSRLLISRSEYERIMREATRPRNSKSE
jgi:hypothetical protein